jgi:hypothetical protein
MSVYRQCIHEPDTSRVKLHRPVEGEIKTVTVKRDVNHWYVCFSVEREPAALPESREAIGIDVGLDSFAVLSDETEIDNPRQLKGGLGHLRRCQRRLSAGSVAATAAAKLRFCWPRRTGRSEISAPPFTTMSVAGWWIATA